jgi:hypothetical protein
MCFKLKVRLHRLGGVSLMLALPLQVALPVALAA